MALLLPFNSTLYIHFRFFDGDFHLLYTAHMVDRYSKFVLHCNHNEWFLFLYIVRIRLLIRLRVITVYG